jgi:hypothetical protein
VNAVNKPACVMAIILAASGWSYPETKSPLVGAGAESCQTFLRTAGPSGLSDSAANQWVMGYLSGRVAADAHARHAPFVGPEAIMASIVSYCRAANDFEGLDVDAAAASFFLTESRTHRR